MQDIKTNPTFLEFKEAVEKYFSESTATPETIAAAVEEFYKIARNQQEKPCE